MTSELLKDLMQQSKSLTVSEKMKLIIYLARTVSQEKKPARKWTDIRSVLHNPDYITDTQEWVLRTRSEEDEHLEQKMIGKIAMNEN